MEGEKGTEAARRVGNLDFRILAVCSLLISAPVVTTRVLPPALQAGLPTLQAAPAAAFSMAAAKTAEDIQ